MDFNSGGLTTWKKISLGAGAVLLVILIVALGFFYTQYQNLKKNPNSEKEAETKTLVAQVSKHYDLPTDETPTVATVADKSKVIDQPFFAKAETGDKILIYRKNKLAILYRPSDNKLINVGPIDLDAVSGASGTGTPAPATPAVAKVGLYNASSTVGITNDAEKKLTSASYASSLSITEKKNATTKSSKIVIVNVSGNQKDLASKIAATLGGEVGDLPAGEAKPATDIAVYVGK